MPKKPIEKGGVGGKSDLSFEFDDVFDVDVSTPSTKGRKKVERRWEYVCLDDVCSHIS